MFSIYGKWVINVYAQLIYFVFVYVNDTFYSFSCKVLGLVSQLTVVESGSYNYNEIRILLIEVSSSLTYSSGSSSILRVSLL